MTSIFPYATCGILPPATIQLYARGYPELRVVTDVEVEPSAAARLAAEAIDDVDPVLPVHVPRAVARRFLLAYPHGAEWDLHTERAREARDEALRGEGSIDAARLDAVLDLICPAGFETYAWRAREVTYLYEVFLGTDVVVHTLVRHLERALRGASDWRGFGDRQRTNATVHGLAVGLGMMRFRMPGGVEAWREALRPLTQAAEGSPHEGLADLVLCLADDARETAFPSAFAWNLELQRHDTPALRARFSPERAGWYSARHIAIAGVELLDDIPLDGLIRMPRWRQRRFIEEVGTLGAPGVVRAVASLLTSRSAQPTALAWMQRHAELAAPILRTLRGDDEAATRDAAERGLEALQGTLERLEVRDEETLNTMIHALFPRLAHALGEAGDDEAAAKHALRAAYVDYCALRAEGGDVIPGAYFTHYMGDYFKDLIAAARPWCGGDEEALRETVDRWFDWACELPH